MAKASKKRGKKKAVKRAKKSRAKKSVKRAPAKRKGAKRKPAKRAPAKRAPEPWPMIFAVLLAVAVALIAAWHFNGAAQAAVMAGSVPAAPAEAVADLCASAAAKLSHSLSFGALSLN
jgi:Flp pilus assembly protein TadB